MTGVLDQLETASYVDSYSASISWRNSDGWAINLEVFDMGVPGMDAMSSYLTLQRVSDSTLWVADNTLTGSCNIDVRETTPDSFSGVANCSGLRWADGLGSYGTNAPDYIEGQPRFDLDVTFEAHPNRGTHG